MLAGFKAGSHVGVTPVLHGFAQCQVDVSHQEQERILRLGGDGECATLLKTLPDFMSKFENSFGLLNFDLYSVSVPPRSEVEAWYSTAKEQAGRFVKEWIIGGRLKHTTYNITVNNQSLILSKQLW